MYVCYLVTAHPEQSPNQTQQPPIVPQNPSEVSIQTDDVPTNTETVNGVHTSAETVDGVTRRDRLGVDININALILAVSQAPPATPPASIPEAEPLILLSPNVNPAPHNNQPPVAIATIDQHQEQSSERKPVQKTFISTLFSYLLFL